MFSLRSSRSCNIHALLDNVYSRNHVRIGINIVFNARNSLCISKQTFHFFLGAAVTELKVIEHSIVLLCKALIRILYGFNVRTHFIGIVGHIRNSHIRIFGGFLSITAEGRNEACGEAGDGFHVLVCGHTCRLICVCGILLNRFGGILKQSVNAAYKLLIIGV